MRDGEIQTAAFGKIFCRADADVRRILTLEPGERGFTLAAKADDYGSGSSAREQTIAQRHALTLVLQPSTTTGQPYAYATATNVGIVYHFDRPSGLDPSRIDGDAEALFSASFRHGLRRSYHGDYTCIRNGYLALTVTGQEIDGDYSISVNPGDAPPTRARSPAIFLPQQ